MTVARYAVHTAKALETIVWLAHERPGIDIYHVVKCAFYADKFHLNEYGRPIAGDDYDADIYGPLGRCIYRLLKGDPIEMLALGGNGNLPFTIDRWQVVADRAPNLRLLSESDTEALRHALEQVGDLTFRELFDLSHEDEAYIAADGGRIRYEDLLEGPDREAKAEDLAEAARFAVF